VRAQFERIREAHGPLLAFERADPEFPFTWHFHPEYELTLITDSSGQRLVGNGIADYEPGDLVLLGPNLPHSWRSGPYRTAAPKIHRAVVVQFREDFVGEQFFQLADMQSVVQLLQASGRGLAFGHTRRGREVAEKVAALPPMPAPRRVIAFLSILMELSEEPDAVALSTGYVRPICRVEDQQRIDAICAYLSRNYANHIESAELPRLFHMQKASLCRFFKRATGRTMTEYVNELRVGAAAQLLTSTDLSILEIALQVGFEDYSHFNRQFRKVKGIGPRGLRRKFSPSHLGYSATQPATR
jgi:AraC-like DNA-binding protein